MSNKVALEIQDSIGWLRFLDEPHLNPMNAEFVQEVKAALSEVRDRDDLKVLLVGGGECFCAGGDLIGMTKQVKGGARSTYRFLHAVDECVLALYEFPKPTIAVVRGPAVGGGMGIALAADMILAGRSAKFGQVFINVAAAPDSGSSWLLPRRVGMMRAKELIYTGRVFGAEEALELGLVLEIHDDDKLIARAEELAETIAKKPSFAITFGKQLLHRGESSSFADAIALEGTTQSLIMQSNDFHEALTAFSEKRKPVFQDK